MRPIEQAVWAYWEGGLSFIPINPATKRPYGKMLPQAVDKDGALLFYRKEADGKLTVTTEPTTIKKGAWEPYQKRQPAKDEVQRWLRMGMVSVAGIGGRVSGGVEIMDFDVAGYYERWCDLVGSIAETLPKQRTGGNGIQIAYRCPSPTGNQKLAWHPDSTQHSGRRIAIETRGEHGYALLPPSLHPSGRHYELLQGRFSRIPNIEQEERDRLLACARKLCQAPRTRQEIARGILTPHEPRVYNGESVIDAYNAKYGIEETLRRYNYIKLGNGRWSRPGKEDSGGVVVFDGDNKSYHYSSNDPLDADLKGLHQPRSPFDFYLEYEHNGDWTSAVREAAEELGMAYSQQEDEDEADEDLIIDTTDRSQEEIIEERTLAFFRWIARR